MKTKKIKKCRITKTQNGFSVRSTNFLHQSEAEMYATILANCFNNGKKLIYVSGVEEAIQKHNELEGIKNDNWLRLCWGRNAGTYLHTRNMYALKNNSLYGNIHQWYRDADQWWEYMTDKTKALFSGIDTQEAINLQYNIFWSKIPQEVKDNLRQYWMHRVGAITFEPDEFNSLQKEIISELAEVQLEKEFKIYREEMYDENGSFYREYQDRFNDIYNNIEERLITYDFTEI